MVLLDDVDRRRERRNQDAENSARLAQAYASFTSEGQGTYQYPKRVAFGLTFTERPMVSYGTYIDLEALADIEDLSSEDVVLPNCLGVVTEWDQDERDFYTGCWIAARVAFDITTTSTGETFVVTDALPRVEHHFTFSAIGMKDIPPELSDAIE